MPVKIVRKFIQKRGNMEIDLVELIIIALVAWAAWSIIGIIAMDATLKRILTIVLSVIIFLWVLNSLGLYHSGSVVIKSP